MWALTLCNLGSALAAPSSYALYEREKSYGGPNNGSRDQTGLEKRTVQEALEASVAGGYSISALAQVVIAIAALVLTYKNQGTCVTVTEVITTTIIARREYPSRVLDKDDVVSAWTGAGFALPDGNGTVFDPWTSAHYYHLPGPVTETSSGVAVTNVTMSGGLIEATLQASNGNKRNTVERTHITYAPYTTGSNCKNQVSQTELKSAVTEVMEDFQSNSYSVACYKFSNGGTWHAMIGVGECTGTVCTYYTDCDCSSLGLCKIK